MERLTEKVRNYDGTASSKKSLVVKYGMRKGTPSNFCSAIVTKLADYEDLDNQGRLLKLPCKVGDTVWCIGNKFMLDYEVRGFIIDYSGIACVRIAKEINGSDYWNNFTTDEIGKTIFLVQAEAEEALKRMEDRDAGI